MGIKCEVSANARSLDLDVDRCQVHSHLHESNGINAIDRQTDTSVIDAPSLYTKCFAPPESALRSARVGEQILR